MKPITESEKIRELLEGCKRNDRKSQELLYKQFFGFAMGICLRYSKSREEALEILNDAFLKVFTKLDAYDFVRPFPSWLKRIIVNTAIDKYRSQNKHYFHLDIDEAFNVNDNEEKANEKLAYEDILKLLNKLPKNFQLNFNLFIIEGYSHEEIGKMLNISPGTSKSNVSRAREILRNLLKKNGVYN